MSVSIFHLEYNTTSKTTELRLQFKDDSRSSYSVKISGGCINVISGDGQMILSIPYNVIVDETKDYQIRQWEDHVSFKFNIVHENEDMVKLRKKYWTEVIPAHEDINTLRCRLCLHPFSENKIHKVQRLPGEHWEEMMDTFWVCACTKPALSHSPVLPKGSITAISGRLLIGETYVLLHSEDVTNGAIIYSVNEEKLDTTLSKKRIWNQVYCDRCKMHLGMVEYNQKGLDNFKLWKHRITNSVLPSNNSFKFNTLETTFTSLIISTMKVHQCYRFFIRSYTDNQIIIQLLVTNWDLLLITNSDIESTSLLRPAIKIVFNDCTKMTPQIESMVNKWNDDRVENLLFYIEDCIAILELLYERNEQEPPSRRLWINQMKTSYLYYLYED